MPHPGRSLDRAVTKAVYVLYMNKKMPWEILPHARHVKLLKQKELG